MQLVLSRFRDRLAIEDEISVSGWGESRIALFYQIGNSLRNSEFRNLGFDVVLIGDTIASHATGC